MTMVVLGMAAFVPIGVRLYNLMVTQYDTYSNLALRNQTRSTTIAPSRGDIFDRIMNILATCSFCCTATLIYKKHHTMKGAIIGLAVGVVSLVVVMLLWNYLITPVYQKIPREVVAAMLPTVFLPFNLVKGGMNMAATLLLYKPVVTALRKAGLVAPSSSSGQSKKLNPGFLLFSLALLATFVTCALVLMGVI